MEKCLWQRQGLRGRVLHPHQCEGGHQAPLGVCVGLWGPERAWRHEGHGMGVLLPGPQRPLPVPASPCSTQETTTRPQGDGDGRLLWGGRSCALGGAGGWHEGCAAPSTVLIVPSPSLCSAPPSASFALPHSSCACKPRLPKPHLFWVF